MGDVVLSDEDEELAVLRTKLMLIDGDARARLIEGALKPGWAFVQDNKYFYFDEHVHRKFYATERECLKDGLKLLLQGSKKLSFGEWP